MSTAPPTPYVDNAPAGPQGSPTPTGVPYADQPQQQPAPQSQPSQQQQAPQQQGPGSEQDAAQQGPAAPAGPVLLQPQKRGGLLGVIDDIANVLTGNTTRPEIAQGSDGQKYVKETTLSRGEQWRLIAGEAIHGGFAGLAAGKGAGNMAKAGLAGIESQEQDQAKRDEQRQNMTAEARQANIDQGNRVLQNMQLAKMGWELTRSQAQASHDDVQFFRSQQADYIKMGGEVVGTAKDPNDIAHILKTTPDAVQQMVQHGTLVAVQAVDDEGKRVGTTFIRMPDNYASQLMPSGAQFPVWNGQAHKIEYQNSADPMTKAQFQTYSNAAALSAQQYADAQHKQKLDDDKAKLEVTKQQDEHQLHRSQEAQNYAEAERAKAQTKALNTASSAEEIHSNAQQLVEGTADPANLSKRSKSYDATIAAANAISMQTTGKPFDLAKAAGDYKFATNPATTNTLNYLNSLVGHNNDGGNLAKIVEMSDKLPRGDYPPINNVAQWAKLSAGNPQVAAYRAAVVEVADQLAKVLQGSNSGGTSDAKMRQAAEVFDKGFNAQQMKAVANDTLRPLLANRKQEIIGSNRYLERWNAPQQAAKTFSLSAWQRANPQGDANAAKAAAAAQGYQVVQ